ncbi:MAG: hypothetical protein V8S22_04310 [Lachnospiraceae bacterium]
MLVRKGNAFYEIDEDCMKRKGLPLPTEEDGALLTYGENREEKQDQKDIRKREKSVRKRTV